jgi:hypothetical protein
LALSRFGDAGNPSSRAEPIGATDALRVGESRAESAAVPVTSAMARPDRRVDWHRPASLATAPVRRRIVCGNICPRGPPVVC